MMFKKTGKMIDIRELQKKGVVKIPKKEISIPTTNDGFIELKNNKNLTPKTKQEQISSSTSNTEFFGFMDTPITTTNNNNSSTQIDGYNEKEVNEKVSNLDNKIYKLENRIELLEKKLKINQSSNTNIGTMGW